MQVEQGRKSLRTTVSIPLSNGGLRRSRPLLGGLVGFTALLLFVALGRCGGDRLTPEAVQAILASDSAANRAAILQHIANDVIYYRYQQLQTASNSFSTSVAAFAASPTAANVDAMRTALSSLRQAASRAEAFYFGPAMEERFYLNLNPYPFNFDVCYTSSECSTNIEDTISGSTTLDQPFFAGAGVGVKGLTAVEYLVYDNGSGVTTSSAVATALTGRRLTYLQELTAYNDSLIDSLVSEYNPSSGNFVAQISTAGSGSAYFDTQLDAFSELLVQMIDQTSRLIDRKIGFPAGLTVKSGGTVRADSVEARFADESLLMAYQSFLSAREIYRGREDIEDSPGFSDFLAASSTQLDGRVDQAFDEVDTRFADIREIHGNNLTQAIQLSPERVSELYQSIRDLRVLLSSDIVSATGTNPGVGSTDGD